MITIIKIKCCLCNKDMGEKDGKGVTGVSHAYCPECLKAVMEDIERKR